MPRKYEIFDKMAKEFASELLEKENDQEYKFVLDRTEIVRKLSVVMDRDYSETSTMFDSKVNEYKKRLRF